MNRTPIVIATLLVACATGKPGEAPVPPPVGPPTTDIAMLKHWVVSTKVRDAVIAGNLTTVLAAAQGLTDEPARKPNWQPYVDGINHHAEAIRTAESLRSAAMATGALGATCGSCHLSMNVDIGLSTGQAPEVGDDPRTHMHRHAWAVSAMWEGLIGPSDGRWNDGIGMLAERPLHDTEKSSEFITTEVVTKIGETIHDLGVRGTNVTDPGQRAEIFGELIAACADCHGQTQMGPR